MGLIQKCFLLPPLLSTLCCLCTRRVGATEHIIQLYPCVLFSLSGLRPETYVTPPFPLHYPFSISPLVDTLDSVKHSCSFEVHLKCRTKKENFLHVMKHKRVDFRLCRAQPSFVAKYGPLYS